MTQLPPDITDLLRADLRQRGLSETAIDELMDFAESQAADIRAHRIAARITVLDLPEITEQIGVVLRLKDQEGLSKLMFKLGLQTTDHAKLEELTREVLAVQSADVRGWWGELCTICDRRDPHRHN